jgi:hypothetical protein
LAIAHRGGELGRPIVVVNDRVDVAAALTADGAHVGADDLSVPLTRRVIGPERLVGRTAHSVAEARAAVIDGADYLGIGVNPIYLKELQHEVLGRGSLFLRTIIQISMLLSLFALPLLSVPAILTGATVNRGLMQTALAAVGLFVIAALASAVVLTTDRPLAFVGSSIQSVLNRIRRRRPPLEGLPDRLLAERDFIKDVLGGHLRRASLGSLGKVFFDFGALLAALAIGSGAILGLVGGGGSILADPFPSADGQYVSMAKTIPSLMG